MIKYLLPFLLFLFFQPVFAQQAALTNGSEITLHLGVFYRGAGHSLADQMKQNGFGEEGLSSGTFFGPEENPVRDESAAQLGFRYLVKRKYPMKALLNYKETEVEGYAFFYDYLKMRTAVITVAPLLYLPVRSQFFRAGAGPAVHVAKATLKHNEAEQSKKNFNKFGFVLEGGLSYPAYKRFYADLQVQYFFVGKEDLGTHTLTGTDFSDNTVSTQVDFTETSFNSLMVSVGIGYRFRRAED